ncbi:MAG: LCP family protein [Clostridia bacterium]|nr:LCP family protein [Clostridia bacterium]
MKIKYDRSSSRVIRKLILIALVLLIIFGAMRIIEVKLEERRAREFGDLYGEDGKAKLYYNDKVYEYNDDIETFLLMGLDKFEGGTSSSTFSNNSQCDFLVLFCIDKKNKTYNALQINRDTMTDMPIIAVGGEDGGKTYGQIALAHTYGSGKEDSCRNTKKAVEWLLLQNRIDHYLSITMDAVGKMNDAVGGVTVELLDDFTFLDPEYKEGATVKLLGDDALSYVRARGQLEDSTNISRMARQRQYIMAFKDAYTEYRKKNNSIGIDVLSDFADSLVSDCNINMLSEMAEELSAYDIGQIYTLDGESKKGEKYMEFYVDSEKLKGTVIELLYRECQE